MQNFYFKDSTEANENGDRNLFVIILVRDHVQYIQSMPVRPSVSVRQLCFSQLPWTEKKIPWDRGEGSRGLRPCLTVPFCKNAKRCKLSI